MATNPVAFEAADGAVETPDPLVFPSDQPEGSVVSLTGHHALFPMDDLVRRLADRALMPSSQLSGSERQLIDDVLAALLPKLDYGHRAMLSERFLTGSEVPRNTVRLLAADDSELGCRLLEKSPALCELDLVVLLRTGTEAQQRAIARRRELSAHTVAALAADGVPPTVLKELLANDSITLPQRIVRQLVDRAAVDVDLVDPLLHRREMGPSDAFRLFWHARAADRIAIAKKFSVDRHALEFGELNDMEDAIHTLNPATIAALEIIAGPQRKSDFDPEAALTALQHGQAEVFFDALANGAGLSRDLVRTIVADASGEPLAILCKALRLGRGRFVLVLGLFQKAWDVEDVTAQTDRLTMVYDSLSVDRADLILRYWNYAPASVSQF